MNSSSPSRSGIGRTLAKLILALGVLALTLILGAFILGMIALRSLQPSPDMRDVRNELLACLGQSPVASIEVAIPAWAATLGRVGASLTDLDPHLEAALQTAGGGQLGVYELSEQPPRETVRAMLQATDRSLGSKGWTRMVTVLDGGESVAVYGLDSSMRKGEALEIFLLVLSQQELVMLSARGYPEPMLELASAELADARLGERLR
jgi:hypothetical protein